MDIELKNDGTVKLFMKEYTKESRINFGETVEKEANNPAKHNLFTVGESKILSQEKVEKFHHIVAKLLYTRKRVRGYTDLAVSFMCTRVSCSIDEDWEKLRRLLH